MIYVHKPTGELCELMIQSLGDVHNAETYNNEKVLIHRIDGVVVINPNVVFDHDFIDFAEFFEFIGFI